MLVGKLTDNVFSTQRGTSSVSMNLSWTLDMVPRTGSSSTRRGCSGREEEKGCLKAGWVCHLPYMSSFLFPCPKVSGV